MVVSKFLANKLTEHQGLGAEIEQQPQDQHQDAADQIGELLIFGAHPQQLQSDHGHDKNNISSSIYMTI